MKPAIRLYRLQSINGHLGRNAAALQLEIYAGYTFNPLPHFDLTHTDY
jgi:hypothetical protein